MIFNRVKLVILIGIISLIQNIYSQPKILRGFKIGMDFTDLLTNKSGSLPNNPSLSLGYFTSINSVWDATDAFLFGIEINYTRINHYRTNYHLRYSSEYIDYLYVFDQRFRYAFIEIGIFPEFHHLFNDHTVIGLFAGPSGGIGTQILYLNEVSRTVLDTLNYSGGMYGPYGEYNMDYLKSFACFNLGARYYFNSVMIDLRYRYTYVGNLNEVNHFKNIFLQFGVLL